MTRHGVNAKKALSDSIINTW